MDKEIENDCEILKKALKEKGDKLINFILSKTKKERQLIRAKYKVCWGVDLLVDIDKSLFHNFRKTVRALFQRPAEFDAECLYHAMKGIGTNEEIIIEILCTRSNTEIKEIINEFSKISFDFSLEHWILSETSGAFQKILISLIQCQRNETKLSDENKCKQLAQDLYEAGENKLGTDQEIFNKIFSTSSPAELYSINEHYSSISKNDLRTAIEKEYSGDIRNALLTILDSQLNPSEYYARRVNKAVKGLGTRDRMLIRTLVSREEIDIPEIRECYKKIYGRHMVDDVSDDTSGDYGKILTGIVRSVYR